jgi:hypothetical protein
MGAKAASYQSVMCGCILIEESSVYTTKKVYG